MAATKASAARSVRTKKKERKNIAAGTAHIHSENRFIFRFCLRLRCHCCHHYFIDRSIFLYTILCLSIISLYIFIFRHISII